MTVKRLFQQRLVNVLYDSSRVPSNDHVRGDISGYDASCADDRTTAYRHTLKDQTIHAYEYFMIDPDGSRLRILGTSSTEIRIHRMKVGIDDRAVGSDGHVVADHDPFRGANRSTGHGEVLSNFQRGSRLPGAKNNRMVRSQWIGAVF